MPIYEYKCPNCTLIVEYLDNQSHSPCPVCTPIQHMNRYYSFSIRSSFQPHFNPSVGKYVSSRSEFENELKVLSDKTSHATGLTHNFQPHDSQDHEAFGLTDSHVAEAAEFRERANN